MWQVQASFCPLCGAPLAERTLRGRARKACTACRFVLFHGPAGAAAAVVLNDDREVLLVRRAIQPFQDRWALPAGYQEIDEAPAETAIRETREETGLAVTPVGLLDVLHVPDDPRKPANVAVFLCRPDDPTAIPRGADDALEARYFPLDGLPADLGFPNNRRILEALAKGAGYPLPLPGSRHP
ncbi:MAG: NUDIX domain-containing protein [Planctomycetota bacterium]|nr:NUDIX domain-containing protein [Planctomycetota bacterium]